jgi:YD repeat-containing protein
VEAAYAPKPGTLGTLRALEGTALVVDGAQPGPVTLLDANARPYYPRRWEYTAADGRVFVIDRLSGVESVREPNGHTLTISAGGITHSAGPRVQFLRDGFGRILQITDPKGNAHRYGYDGAGDLADYANPNGQVTRHLYDGRHGLLEVRDPRRHPRPQDGAARTSSAWVPSAARVEKVRSSAREQ